MFLKQCFLVLWVASALLAQNHDTTKVANRFSMGVSLGMLSGYSGVAARYWDSKWGVQVSALPIYEYELGDQNSGDNQDFDGVLLGGVQLMYPLNNQGPRIHEQGGYVHSVAYPFIGFSGLRFYNSLDLVLGGGFGLETRWRIFRMATAVGMAVLRTHNLPNDQSRYYLIPSFDLSILVGI